MLLSDTNADPLGLVGRVFDGIYEMHRVIGSGSFGVVYEAEHLKLHQRCAVKVLKLERVREPEVVMERFWREARSCHALKQAGAIEIYDARVEDPGQRLFYAMELLSGVSLHTKWISYPRCRMDLVEALGCIRQVAAFMEVAHRAGIIHRDLKPENIFLCLDGSVKVLDFGCALLANEPRLTAPGVLIGVPYYMPPEQLDVARSKPDSRMDIYALGVTLYHLLSGRYVYRKHHDPVVIAKEIYLAPPVDIADAAPDLSPAIHALIRRAMARDPEERFQSMEALERESSRFLRTSGIAVHSGPNALTLSRTKAQTMETLRERLRPRLTSADASSSAAETPTAKTKDRAPAPGSSGRRVVGQKTIPLPMSPTVALATPRRSGWRMWVVLALAGTGAVLVALAVRDRSHHSLASNAVEAPAHFAERPPATPMTDRTASTPASVPTRGLSSAATPSMVPSVGTIGSSRPTSTASAAHRRQPVSVPKASDNRGPGRLDKRAPDEDRNGIANPFTE